MLAPSSHKHHQEPKQRRTNTPNDVPGRRLGKTAGKGVADLIRRRVRRIYSDNQYCDADGQQHRANNSLRSHGQLPRHERRINQKQLGAKPAPFMKDAGVAH
jgi:hypothetical protein